MAFCTTTGSANTYTHTLEITEEEIAALLEMAGFSGGTWQDQLAWFRDAMKARDAKRVMIPAKENWKP